MTVEPPLPSPEPERLDPDLTAPSAGGRPSRRLRQARAAVFAAFAVNGAVFTMWAAYIPLVKDKTGLDTARLGLALLGAAIGALLTMPLDGQLIDRIGSRTVCRVAVVAFPLALIGPGQPHGFLGLTLAMAAIGVGTGALDMSMNVQAVEVERGYGRPIMAAFHAFFSLGGFAGALAGAALVHADLAPHVALPLASAVLVGIGLLAGHWLLPGEPREKATKQVDGGAAGGAKPKVPAAAWLLGVLGFCALIGEGAAGDWSAVHLREDVGASPAVAALGVAGFSASMTLGRLGGDRLVLRFGPRSVLRWGGVSAALGILAAATASAPAVAIAGWTLAGAGLAGVFPLLFSAAANLAPESAGVAVSRMATIAYMGMIAGPVLIGQIGEHLGLPVALAVAAGLAGAVALGGELAAASHPSSRDAAATN